MKDNVFVQATMTFWFMIEQTHQAKPNPSLWSTMQFIICTHDMQVATNKQSSRLPSSQLRTL